MKSINFRSAVSDCVSSLLTAH